MSGRRVLVTGASSGIGEAFARLAAQQGYRVALLARREDRLRAIAADLEGSGHLVLPCDLTRPDEIDASAARIGEEFGALDLVVNNAGVGYRARVVELDPELLRSVFDTNVFGLLLVCRAVHALLVCGHKPVVCNVSSVVGRRGIPGQAAYSASKAAVTSIGEALRVEWAEDDIAVCTLAPGLTTTGFFEAQANPSALPDPDLSTAAGTAEVAQALLALDRKPRPEVSLRPKWRLLGVLSVLAPRLADRMLAARLGERWVAPRR